MINKCKSDTPKLLKHLSKDFKCTVVMYRNNNFT